MGPAPVLREMARLPTRLFQKFRNYYFPTRMLASTRLVDHLLSIFFRRALIDMSSLPPHRSPNRNPPCSMTLGNFSPPTDPVDRASTPPANCL